MFESVIRLLFVGASGIAGGLGAFVVLSAFINFARWVVERRRPRWLQIVMARSRPSIKTVTPQSSGFTRWILLGLAAGLAFKAALTGGVLIAIFLAALGLALYFWFSRLGRDFTLKRPSRRAIENFQNCDSHRRADATISP